VFLAQARGDQIAASLIMNLIGGVVRAFREEGT
jgi:hypothetical protein